MRERIFNYMGITWTVEIEMGASATWDQPADGPDFSIIYAESEWADEGEFMMEFFSDLSDRQRVALWPPRCPIDGEGLGPVYGELIGSFLQEEIENRAWELVR